MDEPVLTEAQAEEMRYRQSRDISEGIARRQAAWGVATELVEPIVEVYGLEPQPSGPMFTTNHVTEVEQHIESTLRIANWLLTGET